MKDYGSLAKIKFLALGPDLVQISPSVLPHESFAESKAGAWEEGGQRESAPWSQRRWTDGGLNSFGTGVSRAWSSDTTTVSRKPGCSSSNVQNRF